MNTPSQVFNSCANFLSIKFRNALSRIGLKSLFIKILFGNPIVPSAENRTCLNASLISFGTIQSSKCLFCVSNKFGSPYFFNAAADVTYIAARDAYTTCIDAARAVYATRIGAACTTAYADAARAVHATGIGAADYTAHTGWKKIEGILLKYI